MMVQGVECMTPNFVGPRIGRRAALLLARTGAGGEARRLQLMAAAGDIGVSIVEVVRAGGRNQRGLKRLLHLAVGKQIDSVMVSCLDALGRGVVALQSVCELTALGVEVIALDAQWLGEQPALLRSVTLWLIAQDRLRRSAEAKAALSRARAAGARIGRPRKHIDSSASRLATELGIAQAARQLGIGKSTLRRHLFAMRAPQRRERSTSDEQPTTGGAP
jgi:DNA invertase Pin-like site-specific DNA recombinase